jgi:phosphatidylglycerophosphate synthase
MDGGWGEAVCSNWTDLDRGVDLARFVHGRAGIEMIKSMPIVLTGLRVLLAPVVVLLSLYAPHPEAFAVCLIAAFLSDIFDGVLARSLGIATANLRRLDSVADTLFYAACVFAVWHLYPAAITQHAGALALLATLEVMRYALDFLKFRREASYHMWSSKVWGLGLFAGFFSLLVLGSSGIAVSCTIYLGIVADLEGLLISIVLPRWQADVPSFIHALRVRQADAARYECESKS